MKSYILKESQENGKVKKLQKKKNKGKAKKTEEEEEEEMEENENDDDLDYYPYWCVCWGYKDSYE